VVRFGAARAVAAGLSAALLLALVLAAAPPAGAQQLAGPATVVRFSGADHVATAVAVSSATFKPGVAVAWVATQADFPDALAAGAADGGAGPILLTDRAALPQATTDELHRLAPKRIVVVGGPAAVSDDVVAALHADTTGTVTRLAGADRYATAAAISAATFAPGVATAYVATGATYPDALAGGAVAAGHAPILLVTATVTSGPTADELHRLAPRRIVVLGGPAAVADDVVTALRADTAGTVTRLAGADRYATAAAIASTLPFNQAATVWLATGDDFADALVAVPAAVKRGSPLLLTSTAGLPAPAAAELARRAPNELDVATTGQAVGDDVVGAAGAAARPVLPDPDPAAATAVDTATAQLGKPYQWGGAGPDSFDCSGLTMFSWKAAGVSLPHNAAAQQDLLAPVPVTMLQPGDLVFYGDPAYHVGIYIGADTMIEAAQTGIPVRKASIWRSDLMGAARPQ
jgi:cell wall-associated NlpC family hydrolase